MKKRTRIVALCIVAALVVVLVFRPRPLMLLSRAVADIAVGDEIIVASSSYTVTDVSRMTTPEPSADERAVDAADAAPVQLSLINAAGKEFVSVASPGTPVLVRAPVPVWRFTAPPPPAPLPVTIPVPVPVPPSGTVVPVTVTPSLPQPTPPPVTPLPSPSLPGSTQTPTPSLSPAQSPSPSPSATGATHCTDGVWDGDESDMDCGGSCVPCLSTGMFTACWDGADCATGICDTSASQRPLPTSETIATLRQKAGQMWIIPYQGICK